ncbi:MAG: shikimate kinase [Candidatus Cloacimonetes bacterium]|nr:shikimate kinase [Candidatus Cloacimonadota bacterium]
MGWIVLIGQRACGKTSLGMKLAEHLNLDFIDLDEEIERKEKKNISDIFEVFGEKYFRTLELKTLLSLPKKPIILSSGGGLVTQSEALSFLKQRGKIVHIKVAKADLKERRKNDKTRPLLNGAQSVSQEIDDTYDYREDLYIKSSDLQVDCSGLSIVDSIQNIQSSLCQKWPKF